MKLIATKALLPFGILLLLGCGARSTLDLEGSGGYYHAGTTWQGFGGYFAGGGQPGYGGAITGYGGAIVGYGGTRPGYGGSIAGGGPGSGGTIFGSGGYVDGGTPGSGGRPVTGGAGGAVLGGAGGRGGGQGGYVDGGSSGRGGTTSSGGTAGTGGRGGAGGTGGTGGIGGTPVTGGTFGTGGTYPIAGTLGSGGVLGTGGSTCPPLAANEELIDDLNDGDRFIPTLNGRSGAWFDSHDTSPTAKMFPDPDFVPTATGDACRKYAAYVYGSGCVLWGADLFFGLGAPYNASKYTGISFWAKVDPGAAPGVRVAFPDKDTQPEGGLCQTSSSAGANQCYDHYGYRMNLTTSWTKYDVTFSSLTQDGWGRGGTGFDPSTIFQVQFMIPVGATFGMWIDDVAFTF